MEKSKSRNLLKALEGGLWRLRTPSKWQKRILNYSSGEGTARSNLVSRHYEVCTFGGVWHLSGPSVYEVTLHGHSL